MGACLVTQDPARFVPAFYSARGSGDSRWSDWWVLLHPPYTLWLLSYVAIGACLAPHVDGGRLTATLIAFGLAVGVSAHALDELHGRPLRTAIPRGLLVFAAATSLVGAVIIGIVGIFRVGIGLVVFIVIGAVLVVVYSLELFGGRLHNNFVFAASWGAFPVLAAYFAQAETIGFPAVAAAIGAYALSTAQRSLSTPVRALRRSVVAVDGTVTYGNGRTSALTVDALRVPLETALKAIAFGIVAMAVALIVFRFTVR